MQKWKCKKITNKLLSLSLIVARALYPRSSVHHSAIAIANHYFSPVTKPNLKKMAQKQKDRARCKLTELRTLDKHACCRVVIGRKRQEKTHSSCDISLWESTGVPWWDGAGCEPPSPDKYCLPWNYVCHVCPFARFISHRPSSFTFRPSFNWSWLTATERVKTQMLLQCVVLRWSAPFDPRRIARKEERSGSILPRSGAAVEETCFQWGIEREK